MMSSGKRLKLERLIKFAGIGIILNLVCLSERLMCFLKTGNNVVKFDN